MMHHEFKYDGEKYEITMAKDGQTWLLGDYKAILSDDNRILVTSPEGVSKFAHSAKVRDMWWIHYDGHIFCLEKTEPGSQDNDAEQGMTAPMPGKILEVKVKTGQTVDAGELLMVMEAMKMEHRIVAPKTGTISRVGFSIGDQVQQGDTLVEMAD